MPTKATQATRVERELHCDGISAKTSNEKANLFCAFFSNVASKLKNKAILMKDFVWDFKVQPRKRTYKAFKFTKVSASFVEEEIRNFKRHKSTGLDELPPGLLKDCAASLSIPIAHIVNLSLESSIVPTDWKIAVIRPIFKSGSPSSPDNYRPISILPVLSKILERAVHTQLINYLEENELLSACQFGYRKGRSTELAASLFLDNARKDIDNGYLVGAVFLDISKAFDTIGHGVLLSKLPLYGIEGNELQWFTDYLFNRRQCVCYDNTVSSNLPVFCGVPQGSILGPLLFMIFFNDLPDCLKYSRIVQYADDTVLCVPGKNTNDIEFMLNYDLKHVATYFIENDLIVNLKKGKTEVMLLGTRKRIADNVLHIFFNDIEVSSTTHYKYLGTIVNQTLSLSENFEKAYKMASNRVRLLASIRRNVDANTALLLNDSMITPLLMSNVTSNLKFNRTQIDRLSSLDKRIKRVIFRNQATAVKSTTPLYDQCCRHAVTLVKKCLRKDVCTNFHDYFTINKHTSFTKNRGCLLKLPKIKLESTKNAFFFMGAKLYNSLPLEVRKLHGLADFKSKVDTLSFKNT